MEKLSIYRLIFRFSLALCVMLLAGCEVNNVDLTHAHNFVGEYIMNTQIVAIYANNYIDTVPYIVESPMSIYIEGTNLYIQTNCFGTPNINGANPVEIDEDKTLAVISNEPDSKLEDIFTSGASVIVMNGLVYTIRDGIKVKSNPIQVQKTLSDVLKFQESKKFEIKLVDVSGSIFDECSLYFEYQPIYKQDMTLKWDINLIWGKLKSDNPDYIKEIKYHNILQKIE